MTHSQGYRCKTRKVFRRPYRENGRCAATTIQRVYHRGERVEIMVDGSVHRGMPHRYYHGKTGVIFNVNPRAIGIEIDKRVGHRIMKKRIHVRIEHIRPSHCMDAHNERVASNETQKRLVKDKKAPFKQLKRTPTAPDAAMVIVKPKIVDIAPVPFHGIVV